MRLFVFAAIATLAVASPSFAQARYDGPAIELVPVAPDVYVTRYADLTAGAQNGNGTVIVTDRDVLVVDTQDSPGAARKVIAAIRRITKKPVRYVVNTHWHGDHVFGNQAYAEAYPGVEFISHPMTREDLLNEEAVSVKAWVDSGLPAQISAVEQQLAGGKSSSGAPFTPEQKATLGNFVAFERWTLAELRTVKIVPATLVVADSLVIRREGRTIIVRFLGRGNTRGDLSVYIPELQLVVAGDLLVSPVPYGTQSFIGDWRKVLASIRATGATTIVPGHGEVMHDFAYLDRMSMILGEVITQARAAVDKGLDLPATQAAVHVDSLRAAFTGGNPRLEGAFREYFLLPVIGSAWHEVRGEPPFTPGQRPKS